MNIVVWNEYRHEKKDSHVEKFTQMGFMERLQPF